MKAVVLADGGPALVDVPRPEGEVVVRVELAGVCRTDLFVADGSIPVRRPRVLGHEAAGTVVRSASPDVEVGARVALVPATPDGWLGVDVDGAYAEEVAVPASCVVVLPDALPFALGAFVEPTAAAMAVLLAPISPRMRGAVDGEGRIAELVRRVLAAKGFRLEAADAGDLDFAVETEPEEGRLAALLESLRPGGLLVLKSRPAAPVRLPLARIVTRDLRLTGVSHHDFALAARWLAEGTLVVDDLLDAPRPLAAFADAFAEARRPGAGKQLLAVR